MPDSTTAMRTVIELGDISLEVFRLIDGEYRLSKTQILECIKESEGWFRGVSKHSPKALEWLKNKGFRGVSKKVKIKEASKARSAETLPISDGVCVWSWFARKGNEVAMDILEACAVEAIERRADAAFGVQVEEEERNERMKARMSGKGVRRTLTDCITAYKERHPELSDNRKAFMFSNASDQLNRGLFGKSAAKLCEIRNCDRSQLRDTHSYDQLRHIEVVEDLAIKLIDDDDLDPSEAVALAIELNRLNLAYENNI